MTTYLHRNKSFGFLYLGKGDNSKGSGQTAFESQCALLKTWVDQGLSTDIFISSPWGTEEGELI